MPSKLPESLAPSTKALSQSAAPNALVAVASTTKDLYQSESDALKAVRDDFFYWTGKLTDTSLQLSFALIALNWTVFGSVHEILSIFWCKLSVALVIIGLGIGALGTSWMGELLRKRIDYAVSDPARWNFEFKDTAGKRDPWPFTRKIVLLGYWLRMAKTWMPFAAFISFLIALLTTR